MYHETIASPIIATCIIIPTQILVAFDISASFGQLYVVELNSNMHPQRRKISNKSESDTYG